MKTHIHQLTIAQQKQAAFERTLPQGRFYSPNASTAINQYKDAMATLALKQEAVGSALPRAFICTLAIANQLDIDLAERLAVEVPDAVKSSNFVTLSKAFAKGTRTDLRGNHVHEMADEIFGNATLYAATAKPSFTRNAQITALIDDGEVRNPRAAFAQAVAFTTQDILTVAGLLNRPHIKRAHNDPRPYDLLKRTEGLWRQMTL